MGRQPRLAIRSNSFPEPDLQKTTAFHPFLFSFPSEGPPFFRGLPPFHCPRARFCRIPALVRIEIDSFSPAACQRRTNRTKSAVCDSTDVSMPGSFIETTPIRRSLSRWILPRATNGFSLVKRSILQTKIFSNLRWWASRSMARSSSRVASSPLPWSTYSRWTSYPIDAAHLRKSSNCVLTSWYRSDPSGSSFDTLA